MELNFDFTEKRIIITSFFCVAFIIANLITVKIIDVNFLGMQTPAGVLIYPLIYILTNVITNVYGEKAAQRTLILGIATNVLFVFMTTLILVLPSPSFYTGDSSLAFVFTQTPRILIASYFSYLMGNFTTNENKGNSLLRVKNLGAIFTGELVDNIIFIGLSFIGTVAIVDVVIMIFSHWIISIVWNIIAQPFTEKVTSWAKKGKVEEI